MDPLANHTGRSIRASNCSATFSASQNLRPPPSVKANFQASLPSKLVPPMVSVPGEKTAAPSVPPKYGSTRSRRMLVVPPIWK
jgi:hypothetical protein